MSRIRIALLCRARPWIYLFARTCKPPDGFQPQIEESPTGQLHDRFGLGFMISLVPVRMQIPAGCQGARRSASPIESISELLKQGEIDTHSVEPSMLLRVVSDLVSLFFNSWKDQTSAIHKASLKLSSFSETGNSIVMWSHYAAHRPRRRCRRDLSARFLVAGRAPAGHSTPALFGTTRSTK